jgi:hypothetical protein
MALTSGWQGFGGLGAIGCDASCRFTVEEGRQRRRAAVEVTGRSNGGLHLSGKRGALLPGGLRGRPWRAAPARLLARLDRGEGGASQDQPREGEVAAPWGRARGGGLGQEAEGRRKGGKEKREKEKREKEKEKRKNEIRKRKIREGK